MQPARAIVTAMKYTPMAGWLAIDLCLVRIPLSLFTPCRMGISQVEQKIKTTKKQMEGGRKDKTWIYNSKI